MKINYNKLPIYNIEYNVKTIYRNNKKIIKTKCKIYYANTLLRSVKIAIGTSSYCEDENHPYDINIGKHIAESRAKCNMYDTYVKLVDSMFANIICKHETLKDKEREHINDIINRL